MNAAILAAKFLLKSSLESNALSSHMPDLEKLFDSAVNRSNLLNPFNFKVGQLHLRTNRVQAFGIFSGLQQVAISFAETALLGMRSFIQWLWPSYAIGVSARQPTRIAIRLWCHDRSLHSLPLLHASGVYREIILIEASHA